MCRTGKSLATILVVYNPSLKLKLATTAVGRGSLSTAQAVLQGYPLLQATLLTINLLPGIPVKDVGPFA